MSQILSIRATVLGQQESMLTGRGQRVNVHKHVCNLKFPS